MRLIIAAVISKLPQIFRNHRNYSEADLESVLEASTDRVEPLCELFSQCGGCQYQHISVSVQRTWKRSQVKSLLAKIGDLPDVQVNEPVGTEVVYGYRSKITPHYNPARKAERLAIGFQRRGTRSSLVDVSKCVIASPAINEAYAATRTLKFAEWETKLPKKGATLLFREHEAGVETDSRADVTQNVGDLNFTFRAGEFFQVS